MIYHIYIYIYMIYHIYMIYIYDMRLCFLRDQTTVSQETPLSPQRLQQVEKDLLLDFKTVTHMLLSIC